ncbi:hypothetical protein [Streptomyces liangshanensis]|uniref:hypothetical protein n=1 Tax=Streptomyces liangshanensis TaxID=2717324 RepID=UPI001AAE9AF7|nr:hypothetical protein [Streptomyces liangshanensis]
MHLPPGHEHTELIEVVRLSGAPMPDSLTGDGLEVWAADEVRQALALIAGLPDRDMHRCFFPGWGIRAHGADGPLFEIAFCFQCHNLRMWGPAVPEEHRRLVGFDADSPPAQELLRLFRACDRTPQDATPQDATPQDVTPQDPTSKDPPGRPRTRTR